MFDGKDTERFPSRKNPRLPGFDYSSPNYYFVTVCTWEKRCLFGAPDRLSPFGDIAKQCFKNIPLHFSGVILDKWVIMPNHVHAILVLDGSINLSSVIGLYKSAVTKLLHEIKPDVKVWQASYHDHIIRSQADYERIWLYVDTNPGRWMDDCFYTPDPEE